MTTPYFRDIIQLSSCKQKFDCMYQLNFPCPHLICLSTGRYLDLTLFILAPHFSLNNFCILFLSCSFSIFVSFFSLPLYLSFHLHLSQPLPFPLPSLSLSSTSFLLSSPPYLPSPSLSLSFVTSLSTGFA